MTLERHEGSKTTDLVRGNMPATIGGLVAAVGSLLASLANWGLTNLPPTVPLEVVVSLAGLVTVGIGIVGALVGKWAQRFTTPWEPDAPEDETMGDI